MNSRIPNRQKAPENSDSALVSSQFQPRPFTLGPQSEEASPQQQETPDLQTQLEREKRFGPDFSRVKVRAQAPPVTFESKLFFGEQSNQEDPVTDSMAKPVRSMPASPVNLPPIQRRDAESVGNQPSPLAARMMPPIQRRDPESVGNQPNPLAARMMPPIQRRDAESVVKPPNPLTARMMPPIQRRDAESVVKPPNPLASRMMPVVQRQSERAALNQSQPWIQRIEEQPEAKLEEESVPVQAKLENATIERQPEVEQESEKEDQQTTSVGKLPTQDINGASGGEKLKSDETKDRKAQGIEELPSQLGVASPEAATGQPQSKTDSKPNAAAGTQPKQQPTAQGDSSKNAKADGAGVAGKDGAAPDAKGVVKAATKHIPPETADVAQKAQTQNNSRKEEVAAKKVEATKAVEETSAKKDTGLSASQQLTSAQASFAPPQPKAMFATSSEGISALQPEEVLGTAGNGLVIYQTDNPEKSLAAANAGAFVHQIPEDKAANAREQQRIQAEAAIAQFTASGSQRTAQISALGTTIGPRLQAAAGQATAAVDAAIAQNQSAIINGIDQARAQVQSQAQGAKSQITGQHATTVAAIQASTTAARDRLQTEYQASLAQLSQLESTMAGRIAEPFYKAANDFRTAGVTVGNEAIQIGETFKGQYAGESPPEPSNFITEFLESFDRDTYVQNWRQAKTKAAGDVAVSYRDGLINNANEKANELSTSQSKVLKGMQNLGSTTRTELEVKYNAALQELSQSEQSALETATQALNSQLQSIDQNLNTNLASLDQMQATQLSQLESLGQQQKLGINAQAGQVTAALQEGVNQATTNLQGAFQQFANQAQGIEAPNVEVINSVIAEAQGQLDSLMATTQTELETGINKSEQGIVQQAQQTVGSINTAGQQAASSGSMIAQEFTASMTQEVQNATQAFTQLQNGHTTAVNGSTQKTAGEFKNLTGKVQQQLDGVVQNLTTKLGESVTQLENGLRGSLKGSDQNPSIEKAIDDKAKEAADQVQPAWKSVVKVLIDIVITVAVTVAIAALAASGVGLVAAIGLAALIGATGALVKQGANDLIDGKLSSWQTYATQAGFGAVGGVLQLVGLRGAEKAAGLLTNAAGKTGAKFGIEALGEAGADISQRLAAGEQFSLAMLGVSFGTSLLGGAGGEALNGAFGKLGAKLGVNKIDNAALKTGGEFVTDSISETATDVTSQVVFEGKDLSWQTVGESAGTSAFGNLAGRGANRAYGDRLRNLRSRDRTSTDAPNLDQPTRPVSDTPEPTQIADQPTRPVGETSESKPLVDPNIHRPIGEAPEATTPHERNTTSPEGPTATPEDRKPSSTISETSPTQDATPTEAKADSPDTDKVEVDETSVVAQQTTHDGHQLKVLEDGSVVRCSQCEVLELRYKHLFERKTEYSSQLQTKLNDLDARIKTIRELQQQENTNKADLDPQLTQLKEDLRSIEAERYSTLKSKERAAAERFEALKAGELDKAEKGGRQMSSTDLRQLREIQEARLQELFVKELGREPTNEEVRGMVGYATKKTPLKPEVLEALVREQKDWNEVKNKFVEYPHLMRQIIEQRARVVDQTFNDAIDDLCARPEDYTQDPTLIERLKTDEGKESLKQVKLLPIGSKDLTSDYDATVVGKPGDESLEILAVIAFNKKFKQEWPQESGTVFDTNVYTTGHMPASSLSNRGQQYSQMNAVRSNLKDIEKLQQKLQELRDKMGVRTTQTAINKARRMERQLERLISEKKTEIRETLTQINNLRKASGEEPISASSVINAETTSEAIKTVDSSLNTMRTDLKGKIDAENETKLVGLTEDAQGQMARDQQIMSLVKMKRFMTDAEWQQYSDMMRKTGADESLFAEAKTVSDALGQKLHDRKDSLPDTVRDAENHAANRLYEETLAELIPNLNRLNELREKYKGQELENIPSQDLLEIQTLNIQVNKIQSQALFFANEAYHTGGPVEHVVLNQQMRLGLEVEPKEFSLSVNEQTGFIMEQTEHVKTDKDFGKSLWKSAKYLDRICDAAEKVGEIESRTDMAVKETKIEEQIEAVTDPDLREVYKLREIAVELLKIKKNPVMNDAEKSAEALKIVKGIGWTSVDQYRQKMLNLNKILNERIQAKINNSET